MENDCNAMLASKEELTRGKSYAVRRSGCGEGPREGCKEEVMLESDV